MKQFKTDEVANPLELNGEPWWQGDLHDRNIEARLAWHEVGTYEEIEKLLGDVAILQFGFLPIEISLLRDTIKNWHLRVDQLSQPPLPVLYVAPEIYANKFVAPHLELVHSVAS